MILFVYFLNVRKAGEWGWGGADSSQLGHILGDISLYQVTQWQKTSVLIHMVKPLACPAHMRRKGSAVSCQTACWKPSHSGRPFNKEVIFLLPSLLATGFASLPYLAPAQAVSYEAVNYEDFQQGEWDREGQVCHRSHIWWSNANHEVNFAGGAVEMTALK